MRRSLSVAIPAAALVVAVAGCGGREKASPSTSSPPPAAAGTQDPDGVLARYATPEQMRQHLLADQRFSGFECAQTSRRDTFGGRFIQCSKIAEGQNLFVRLETYADAATGGRVDDGLSAEGWTVYSGRQAGVAVGGDPTLIRDVIDALAR